MAPIPTANPLASFEARRDEICDAVLRVLASGRYILGPEVIAFEVAFSGWLGAGFAVGVASGTDALVLALRALGVGRGRRVVIPALTASATAAAVELAGAEAVVADVEPDTMTMSPASVDRILAADREKSIACLLPVHLYGHPADMDTLGRLAAERGLPIVEDCAQAHGATWRGRRCGTLGSLGAFSFYPTKNLGAFGDGGGVVGCDPELRDRVRLLRQYGWERRYESGIAGMNSRLDEIQAAILNVKLKGLEADNEGRRAIAREYDSALEGLPLVLPARRTDCVPVFHQYVVRCTDRDAVAAGLKARGIETSVLYPSPIHRQPAYRGLAADPAGLGESERAARELLCLPIYPELDLAAAGEVAAALRDLFGHRP